MDSSDGRLRYYHFRRRCTRSRNARGGQSAQLKYCSRILEEMLSKKHASCARPFYNLMDDDAQQLCNHDNNTRNVMDLSTIKVECSPGNTSLLWLCCCYILLFSHFRKRWTVQSIRMHKALLQTSGWFFPTATNAVLLTWRWFHRPGSSRQVSVCVSVRVRVCVCVLTFSAFFCAWPVLQAVFEMWFAKMPGKSGSIPPSASSGGESSNIAFSPDQSHEAEELVNQLDQWEEQVNAHHFAQMGISKARQFRLCLFKSLIFVGLIHSKITLF